MKASLRCRSRRLFTLQSTVIATPLFLLQYEQLLHLAGTMCKVYFEWPSAKRYQSLILERENLRQQTEDPGVSKGEASTDKLEKWDLKL